MLNGAGKDLATGIAALVTNKDTLKAIIDEGIFDAKSLSSMLAGAGKDLATGIKVLLTHKDKLHALAKIFEPSAIAQQLNKRTAGQLESAILQMYEEFLPAIEGRTTIKSGSKPVIAFDPNRSHGPDR